MDADLGGGGSAAARRTPTAAQSMMISLPVPLDDAQLVSLPLLLAGSP